MSSINPEAGIFKGSNSDLKTQYINMYQSPATGASPKLMDVATEYNDISQDSLLASAKGKALAVASVVAATLALGVSGTAQAKGAFPLDGSELNVTHALPCMKLAVGAPGTEFDGFIDKVKAQYKVGSKAVRATLYLNDIGMYSGTTLFYDCDEVFQAKAMSQIVVRKKDSDNKNRYVPYGKKSSPATFITDNRHHLGTGFKVISRPRKASLKLPRKLAQNDLSNKKYAIRTTVEVSPKPNLPVPEGEAIDMNKYKPLSRTVTTPLKDGSGRLFIKYRPQ